MAKQKKEQIKGVVVETLPDSTFKVRTKEDQEILAYLSGKLRFYKIRIIPGDEVLVELSPYDKKRGRIVYRLK